MSMARPPHYTTKCTTHASKVAVLSEFLARSDDTLHVMVVIGGPGSGKSTALKQVLDAEMPAADENVQIWDCGDVPLYAQFVSSAANTKMVMFRREEDDMVRAFRQEWSAPTSRGHVTVAVFEADPSH
jgi:ABC-type nitrate/sulfonate/bicarbonate transport system ATPase subunit